MQGENSYQQESSLLHTPRMHGGLVDIPSPLSYATFPSNFPPRSPGSVSQGWGGSPDRATATAAQLDSPASSIYARYGSGLTSNTSVGELVDKALNRSAAVQVVLRVRPMNSHELRQADPEPCLRVVNDHRMQYRHLEAIVDRGAKAETVTSYTFDRVVPPEVGQRELFEMSGVQELMDAALTGINVSVLAYGQTGSGKTYTMSGLEEHVLAGFRKDDQTSGLISRSVSHLFQRISEDLEGSTTTVKACFSEIYNEVRGVFFLGLLSFVLKNS